MILNCFLDYYCFREGLFWPFTVESQSRTVEHPLLGIPEYMIVRVELPIILPPFLFTWLIISMGFSVQSFNFRLFVGICSSFRVEHVLGALKPRGWNTELNVTTLAFLWPVIASYKSFS